MAWDGTLSRAEFERAALFLVSTWERCCPELPQWTWQTSILGRACGYLALQDVRVIVDRKDHVESHDDDEDDADDHDVEDQAIMYEGLAGDHEQHLYTYHVVYNESYRVPMLLLQGRLPASGTQCLSVVTNWNQRFRSSRHPVIKNDASPCSACEHHTARRSIVLIPGCCEGQVCWFQSVTTDKHWVLLAADPSTLFDKRCQDGRPLEWKSVLQDLAVGSQHISSESRWTFLTQEDHPLLHRPWFALHPCGTSEIMSLVFSNLNAASSVEESAGSGSKWMEKYLLSWMSFACPAVGLVVPSRVFIESK